MEIFLPLLCVQTVPAVQSASYKMSTGSFLRDKEGRPQISHSTSGGCVNVDSCIHIPCGPSWPVMGIPLLLP